jgi:hypothetical protein
MPCAIISDSINDIDEKHQHVPENAWSCIAMHGRRTISVNLNCADALAVSNIAAKDVNIFFFMFNFANLLINYTTKVIKKFGI